MKFPIKIPPNFGAKKEKISWGWDAPHHREGPVPAATTASKGTSMFSAMIPRCE
jgi:hypothetical protein